MRPRVEASCPSGCNISKESGRSLYCWLAQVEMESMHYSAARIQEVTRKQIDLKDCPVKTTANCYHGCLSMFDPPLAWVLPDTQLVYANSQVFFHRRQYDRYCDLSDAFQYFESCYLGKITPEMLVKYNQCRGNPAAKVALLSPRAKRPRDNPFTSSSKGKEEKKGTAEQKKKAPSNPDDEATDLMVGTSRGKKARVVPQSPERQQAYSPSEGLEPENPGYNAGPGYSTTSPSPYVGTSPPAPTYSPIKSREEIEREDRAREKSWAERMAEANRAKVAKAREEESKKKAARVASQPHKDVQMQINTREAQWKASLSRLF
jgi:hypothetical protein